MLRRIILASVDKRDRCILISFCNQYIYKQPAIFSDCWKGYIKLANSFSEHRTVNHSKQLIDKETNTYTDTIEGNWNGVKKTAPVRYRTKKLIDLHLLRFMLKRMKEKIN